jgi:hypothetical protein
MAHFARLDENNIVTDVFVIDDRDTTDLVTGLESEDIGAAFCNNLFGNATWKKTSYNGRFRYRYAGIGYSYNEEIDAFVPPQPYPSWVMDNSIAGWISPLGQKPTLTEEQIASNLAYFWNEDAYQADNTVGWELRTLGE